MSDTEWMHRALELAEKGSYSTTPNPRVGAVIVDSDGNLLGEGWHQKSGESHAEIMALKQAGELAKNAICFVTLEPCAHFGKTPPCADALIEAEIKRVVIACTDPNPLVDHAGIKKLKDANIEVEVGLLEKRAKDLNRAFFHRMKHSRPYVIVKLAASLDGKTALSNGKSKWITSDASRSDVQKFRAQSCAIMTGADTIIKDNPRLNVRKQALALDVYEGFKLRGKQPVRIVLDSKNRLNDSYQIFNDQHPVVIFNQTKNDRIRMPICEQIHVGKKGEYLDLREVFTRLNDMQLNQVWIEAGATLAGALLEGGWVDEFILYQAPCILGSGAKGLVNTSQIEHLDQAIRLEHVSTELINSDLRHRYFVNNGMK